MSTEQRFQFAMGALSAVKPLGESRTLPGYIWVPASAHRRANWRGERSGRDAFTFGAATSTVDSNKKKRTAETPLHNLDEKNTMRVEGDADPEEECDPRELEDDGRFGPPVEAGFGIKKADAATLATRRIVKRARKSKGASGENAPAPVKGLFGGGGSGSAAASPFKFNMAPMPASKLPFQSPKPKVGSDAKANTAAVTTFKFGTSEVTARPQRRLNFSFGGRSKTRLAQHCQKYSFNAY